MGWRISEATKDYIISLLFAFTIFNWIEWKKKKKNQIEIIIYSNQQRVGASMALCHKLQALYFLPKRKNKQHRKKEYEQHMNFTNY